MNRTIHCSVVKRQMSERKELLRQKARRLQHKLRLRPYDEASLHALGEVYYEQQDLQGSVQIIKRILATGHHEARLLLRLGKSYFRMWKNDKMKQELLLAYDTYAAAAKGQGNTVSIRHEFGFREKTFGNLTNGVTRGDHVTAQLVGSYWLEMATILTRLGRHQSALDVFTLIQTLLKEHSEWAVISQYAIAQTLFSLGRFAEAQLIYRELMLIEGSVVIEIAEDNIVGVPHRLVDDLLPLELARITHRMGHRKLTDALYKETWDHAKKSSPEDHFVDITLGRQSFDDWIETPATFKTLAEVYFRENNYVMTAEYYGVYAEKLSDKVDWRADMIVSSPTVKEIIEYTLKRGELLTELQCFEEAEHCAHFVHSVEPFDPIITTRCAACCRPEYPPNFVITKFAENIKLATQRIQSSVRAKFSYFRQAFRERRRKAATKIAAFLRMIICRNRMIGDLLSCTSAAVLVVRLKQYEKIALKTGKAAIADWRQVWNVSCVRIQKAMLGWMKRRSYRVFWRGMMALKRIFLGQLTRLSLRKRLSALQEILEKEAASECLCKEMGFSVAVPSVKTLCCGDRVWSNSLPFAVRQARLQPPRRVRETSFDYSGNGFAWLQSAAKQTNLSGSRLVHDEVPETKGEAIISTVNFLNVRRVFEYKWIPFGVTPDSLLFRLLSCTVLTISSPSFTLTDSCRLVRLISTNKLFGSAWSSVSSFGIYGTNIGCGGLVALVKLGLEKLEALSVCYTGYLNYKFTEQLGKRMMSVETCKLLKLHFDGEQRLGDYGVEILFKHLQYNLTLQLLSLRNCQLTSRSAAACCRYLAVSPSIQDVQLQDNCFINDDLILFIRTAANRGALGALRVISLQDQLPNIPSDELTAMHSYGTFLGVRVDSARFSAEELTLKEVKKQSLDSDDLWSRNIRISIESLRMQGSLVSLGGATKFSKLVVI